MSMYTISYKGMNWQSFDTIYSCMYLNCRFMQFCEACIRSNAYVHSFTTE